MVLVLFSYITFKGEVKNEGKTSEGILTTKEICLELVDFTLFKF